MVTFYIFLFAFCCLAMYFAGELVVNGLARASKFLGWKEFVVAFMIMAFAGSIPNLFLGILSVLNGVPELSFGDIVGNNVIDLTLVIALAAFFAKEGIPARGRVVQTTSMFTVAAAVLPILLFMDGSLSRSDGFLLILFFFFYLAWLFSEKSRFSKVYNHYKVPKKLRFKYFLRDIAKISAGLVIILAVTQGIIISANALASAFNMPLALIGILILGLGSSLPELYFSVTSARRGETRMILGDLMGAVIIPSTLVLGIVLLTKEWPQIRGRQ